MLAKKYRLTEKDVKKVLRKGKPFFSREIVLNIMKNNYNYNRFSIVLGSKSVNSNVERNFFRRRFYDEIGSREFLKNGYDMVFAVKKTTKLDKNNKLCLSNFIKNLNYLINKI